MRSQAVAGIMTVNTTPPYFYTNNLGDVMSESNQTHNAWPND